MKANQRAFLAAYAATCSITRAAKLAKVGRQSHYDWMAGEDYHLAFEQAKEQAAQALEDEAVRRAYQGVSRPVTVAGQRELVRDYSDTLLIFLLKGLRPEKYRENLRVDGSIGINLHAEIKDRLQSARLRLAAVNKSGV